jgi:adenosylhomocysteine nucleosidase
MSATAQDATGNKGIQNTGAGTVNICQSAVGDHASVVAAPGPQTHGAPGSGRPGTRWDVGIITILTEETQAVTAMLTAVGPCRARTTHSGPRFHEAHLTTAGKHIRVVATQALDRGQRPAALACERLRQLYAPAVIVLVGIAGGISPAVSLGDVVIVEEVIYYDIRKETPAGVVRRGQSRPVPAAIRYAINNFFTDHGEPYQAIIDDQGQVPRTCKVLRGPIGSGEAVIADARSSIREYVAAFNDKALALETEAGGLAEAFYETAGTTSAGRGWLAIRGISDHADTAKNDACHDTASWHAAAICQQMLPYLTAGTAQDDAPGARTLP